MNKITKLTKILVTFILIALPIIGFYLGYNHGQKVVPYPQYLQPETNHAEKDLEVNTESKSPTKNGSTNVESTEGKITPDSIIQDLANEYSIFISSPISGNFPWPEESKSITKTPIIEGIEVGIKESLVVPTEEGVQMAFMLDEHLVSFFTKKGFTSKTFYLITNPTIEDKSIIGFEHRNLSIVCARIIMDASKPQLGYKIACGYLQ